MDSTPTPVVRLDQGELYLGVYPTEVQTLLGSCVSITLHDPRLRIGAICHSRLASRECDQPVCGLKVCRNLGDYVTCSLQFMLGYLLRQGTTRQGLQVKLFGGANMFQVGESGSGTVGKRNVDAAMNVIRRERLHLMAVDVGGGAARLLSFNTATGEVLLKRSRLTPDETVEEPPRQIVGWR